MSLSHCELREMLAEEGYREIDGERAAEFIDNEKNAEWRVTPINCESDVRTYKKDLIDLVEHRDRVVIFTFKANSGKRGYLVEFNSY